MMKMFYVFIVMMISQVFTFQKWFKKKKKRTLRLGPWSHAYKMHTTTKDPSYILDNKYHSLFHNGFNCQWNLPQTPRQPDVCAQKSICEVQTGKLEMFSCRLKVRKRGLNQDPSMLFQALSLTHHVTLDQSMELSEPTLFPRKENRTGKIIDYFCSVSNMCLKRGHCLFIPDKRPSFSTWPPGRFLNFMTAFLTLPLVNFPPMCV